MKSILQWALVIFTHGYISSTNLYAQDSVAVAKRPDNWLNVGIGGSSFGLSAGLSYSLVSDNRLYSVRGIHNTEFNILGPEPDETVWDLGVLYGVFKKTPNSLVSISAGLAVVGGINRGEFEYSSGWFDSHYEKNTFLTAGVPFEAQLFWRPLKVLGIGLYGFANLNPEKSFSGGMLSLQLGNF